MRRELTSGTRVRWGSDVTVGLHIESISIRPAETGLGIDRRPQRGRLVALTPDSDGDLSAAPCDRRCCSLCPPGARDEQQYHWIEILQAGVRQELLVILGLLPQSRRWLAATVKLNEEMQWATARKGEHAPAIGYDLF